MAPLKLFHVAVFDDGDLRVEPHQLDDREPGAVDLEIEIAAVCGSDLHTVLGHRDAPPRVALGHEGIGRVTDVDSDAVDLRGSPLRSGDRVVFAIYSFCGTCERCTNGLPMKCHSLFKYGHESVLRPPYATGTIATHIRLLAGVPILKVADRFENSIMVSAGCAVATAAAIVEAAGDSDRALVYGAGAVGSYTAAMLSTKGTAVHMVEPAQDRFAAAQAMIPSLGTKGDDEYPVVIEASGNPVAFQNAIASTDVGGRLVAAGSVSLGNTTVTFDPAVLVTRRITLVGIHNYTPDDFVRAVEWLEEHGEAFGVERLLSPPISLNRIDDAFELMRGGQHLRVLVAPDQTA